MSYEDFNMCTRVAYAFTVCSTKLLEPVLHSKTIYEDCSSVAKPITLQGKEVILKYFNRWFMYQRRSKIYFFSKTITLLFLHGVCLTRLSKRKKARFL